MSVLLAAALLVPSVSFAEANSATVSSLLERIAQLKAQIGELEKQQQALHKEEGQIIKELVKTLREGAEGDDVRAIQALLAEDMEVYPEGVISGYYGRLTAAAVKRFQKKHGFEQVGHVGPKTLKKLNDLLHEDAVELVVVKVRSGATASSTGTGVSGVESVVCHRIPPGHLVAPGWLRKQGGVRPIVPECQTLPAGIAKKLPGAPGTTTPPVADVTLPVVAVTLPLSGATVSGDVTVSANASDNVGVVGVQFLLDGSNLGGEDITSPYTIVWSSLPTTNGTHTIAALARDAAGNRATSSGVNVLVSNATATPDTTSPIISALTVGSITTSSASVSWTTDEAATTKVYYSTVSPVATATAAFQEVSGLATSHVVSLSSLATGTTYHILAVSSDAAGNMVSGTTSFTTLLDTTAPLLSSIVSSAVASTTANVSWATNESATGKVYYGTTSPLALPGSATVLAAAFATSQNVNLASLTASTTYYFVVEASDAANNTATSTEYSFLTTN